MPYYVQDLGVNVIIAGGMGHKAISLFNSYNIEVVTLLGSPVIDALYGYLMGDSLDIKNAQVTRVNAINERIYPGEKVIRTIFPISL